MNTNSGTFTYYNVIIGYQPNTRPDDQFRLQYIRNNNEPIIDVPEDYVCAITQMKLPVNSLPIFIAQPKFTKNTTPPVDNTNYNELVYQITLKYNGSTVTLPVQFESQFVNTIFNPEYVNPRYYFVYNYTDFLEMINKTLLDVLIDLKLLEPTIAGANVPFFYFDSSTQLISLYAEAAFYASDLPGPYIEIYVSRELNRFLQAFTVKFKPTSITEFIQFSVFNKNDLNRKIINGNDYIEMQQDYNSLVLWNDLETIQFTTNLPISSEYVEQVGTNSNSTESILRDFIVFYGATSSTTRTNVNYAVREYNYTNLFGTTPIRNIIITGFWTTKNGDRIPLFIQENETALLKLMFRKKSSLRIN